MAKQFGKHVTSNQYNFQIREQPPKTEVTKNGMQVLCPYCPLPHPLIPGEVAACGTIVKVTAVQMVMPARRARRDKIRCMKCHQTEGGEMVKYNNGWIHATDCMPGTRFLALMPEFSKLAGWVFRLKETNLIRKWVEGVKGAAQEVHEIDAEGKETGTVLGYYFLKKQV